MAEWLPLPTPGSGRAAALGGCAGDAWSPTTLTGALEGRLGHGAAWTGNVMVIWGGSTNGLGNPLDTGGRYDPVTDSWTPTTTVGAPSPRREPVVLWTGHYVLVYGDGSDNTGGRYDPVTDSWLPISLVGAPPPWITDPAAIWTGDRLLVIGVSSVATGGSDEGGFYDPETDSWSPVSFVGAPLLMLRGVMVWTGTRAILWGGSNGSSSPRADTGTIYDPLAETWSPISQVNVAAPRVDALAFWTGEQMLVWGGSDGPALGDGGLYDPVADSWAAVATTGAPPAADNIAAVWTGEEMVVWGGSGLVAPGLGGVYDLAVDTWMATTADGAPDPRSSHTAVWADSEMIVWGGGELQSGGRYSFGRLDDDDEDGFSFCTGDCDDADATSYPDAAELCDGRDNDCNGVVDDPPDQDFDGWLCEDCDDLDPTTYPGAPEINDGTDNQCPGDGGFGVVDELDPTLFFPFWTFVFCWGEQPGATLYEVLRADDPMLTSGCSLGSTTGTCWPDLDDPPSGGLLAYVVRPAAPWLGSWGADSAGVERLGCGLE